MSSKSPAYPYESDLLARHGELMDGAALMALLHMNHERTLRRAIASNTLPVSVFRLAGRKGWYARTRDVAAWLVSIGGEGGSEAQSKTISVETVPASRLP